MFFSNSNDITLVNDVLNYLETCPFSLIRKHKSFFFICPGWRKKKGRIEKYWNGYYEPLKNITFFLCYYSYEKLTGLNLTC